MVMYAFPDFATRLDCYSYIILCLTSNQSGIKIYTIIRMKDPTIFTVIIDKKIYTDKRASCGKLSKMLYSMVDRRSQTLTQL